MLPRPVLAAAFLVLIGADSAFAQGQFELSSRGMNKRARATLTASQLDVVIDGVNHTYLRDRQLDGPQSWGFYNSNLGQAVRWPLSNRGTLESGVRQQGRVRFRAGQWEIVRQFGGGFSGQGFGGGGWQHNVPPEQPAIVIASALPGGNLVTARRGSAGPEIGTADSTVRNNQFLMTPVGDGYFRFSPAGYPDIVVAVPDGAVGVGTRLQFIDLNNAARRAAQFRLVEAEDDFFFIETRLQPGFVWDSGKDAAVGKQLRLMPRSTGSGQLFRLSEPEETDGGGEAKFGSGYPVVPLVRPPVLVVPVPLEVRETTPARVKFANTQPTELWVVLRDRVSPSRSQRLRIPAASATVVELTPNPAAQLGFNMSTRYEVSVYQLVRQSVTYDATARGRGAITDENFSPQGVGWFAIPSGDYRTGDTVDLYALATAAGNPGRVQRIDPEAWKRLALAPTAAFTIPPQPPRPPREGGF